MNKPFDDEEENNILDWKRNIIKHVVDKKNDFNNLKISHITDGLTKQVKIVRFNIKNFKNFNFFELVLRLS